MKKFVLSVAASLLIVAVSGGLSAAQQGDAETRESAASGQSIGTLTTVWN